MAPSVSVLTGFACVFSVVPIRSPDVLKEILLYFNAYASSADKTLFEVFWNSPLVWKGKTILFSSWREAVYTPV